MLLKCSYLSQMPLSELVSKANTAKVASAVNQCPFMSHVRRKVSTTATAPATTRKHLTTSLKLTSQNEKKSLIRKAANNITAIFNRTLSTQTPKSASAIISSKRQHAQKQSPDMICTDTINCPFFQSADAHTSSQLIRRQTLTSENDELSSLKISGKYQILNLVSKKKFFF